MLVVKPIAIFEDNYVWVFETQVDNHVCVVDPGDAKPVLDYLKAYNKSLKGILITHHHWDHVSGIAELLNQAEVPVYGPVSDTVAEITHPLREGESLLADGQIHFDIVETPGHTMDHIAYIYRQGSQCQVFCGDTLFSAGCGRLFEGTPALMWQSLNKLRQLPGDTEIFCTHEYTLANLQFAKAVEPENPAIAQRLVEVNKLRDAGIPSVPTRLALELDTNPFLRCHLDSVRKSAEKYAGQELANPSEIFSVIRGWKDVF